MRQQCWLPSIFMTLRCKSLEQHHPPAEVSLQSRRAIIHRPTGRITVSIVHTHHTAYLIYSICWAKRVVFRWRHFCLTTRRPVRSTGDSSNSLVGWVLLRCLRSCLLLLFIYLLGLQQHSRSQHDIMSVMWQKSVAVCVGLGDKHMDAGR
jgi:hypothetical protein